jgi:rhamnose utilization protein RhaD (predicted bifunctional aldolase and dehydrogenase)
LENHGLLVGADTPSEAYKLFLEVERRLARNVKCPDPKQCPFLHDDELQIIYSPWVQSFVTNTKLIKNLSSISLYPDHVVILGPGIPICHTTRPLSTNVSDWFIVPGFAAIGKRQRHVAVDEMIEALARVALRIPFGRKYQSLTQSECNELLSWDAEKYRRSLR